MKTETYKALLKDLQKLQKILVASQIAAVRSDAALFARMARLHAEAEVGGQVDDFVATAARKSTVLFLLRTVFVRVLEDLGILGLKRIRGEWGFAAFREVAPALDHRAYFRFVFRDLAIDFPALFAPGDDELPLPDEDGCVEVWELWHHPNNEGEHYVWNGDGFDSRFLGDLYQDLDKDIRKRYALLQTPPFVEAYILDHTLTPALVEFDPAALRAKGETFRLIDPTCGSGHFLIGAFHRLADYWRDRHGLGEWDACERALESVWGCDINPHAIDIADFRLLLEVVARTHLKDLERLAALKLNLRTMDSLIPWERSAKQGELFLAKDRLDAYATPKQRSENAAFLRNGFQVVVGNPPYIQPKDDRKGDDYRVFWPHSAKGHYALTGPFFERFFGLGHRDAYVGFITAKAFASSEFGESLILNVVPHLALRRIVDTSRVTVPGHGTPTLLIFGRNSDRDSTQVELVAAARGERQRLSQPEMGSVWLSIASVSRAQPSVGVASLTHIARETLDSYPWELADPAELEVLGIIKAAPMRLEDLAVDFGYSFQTNCDKVFVLDQARAKRLQIEAHTRVVCTGDAVRDYHIGEGELIIYPYDEKGLLQRLPVAVERAMWHWRTTLYGRVTFSKETYRLAGRAWFQWHQFSRSKHRTSLSLVFSDVVTHNQFALDRGGRVFSRHSPVIKMKSTELESHLDILGLLGSSVAGFWMRRTFRSKGSHGIGRGIQTEAWEQFIDPDSSKIGQFPVTPRDRQPRIAIAEALDAAALERSQNIPSVILNSLTWEPGSLKEALVSARSRHRHLTLRMVALQEELDWLTYSSYQLAETVLATNPAEIEPLAPGHRPFEIVLARRAHQNGEESAWWSRHGHDRVSEIPTSYSEKHRAQIQQRIEAIESDSRIGLLETPTYKRRWEPIDWDKEVAKAAELWLLDRLEGLFARSTSDTPAGVLAEPKVYRLEDIVAAWSRDLRVVAVAGILTGTGASVDLTLVTERLLQANALPDNRNRIYSDGGLLKFQEWKRLWAMQSQEDAWEAATAEAKAKDEPPPKKRLVDPDDSSQELDSIPLPRKFEKADFVRGEYFSVRDTLNVPRERFILFADLSPPRFGWNGWRDRERALAQVEAFTLAETDPQQPLPVPTTDDPRRCGVTIGLWESLPDVKRWGSADEYAELLSLAQEACRQPRCPCPVLEAWKAQVLRGEAADGDGLVVLSKDKAKGKNKGKKAGQSDGTVERDSELTASLPERAWVAALLESGKDVDLAGIWALHRRRIDDVAPAANGGASGGQLRFGQVDDAVTVDVRALDERRLAIVIDDLVASGDLEARGRGKKKRYQLVPRAKRA